MRRRPRARFVPLAAASAVTALTVAACGTTSASTTASSTSAKPITVGISLPITGQFSADGLATRNGYELWASDVNTDGGLLGRPVKLVILNDNSDPNTTQKQYTQLIQQDHVDLTLAPFSTLLTASALVSTAKLGYALPAGSATGPSLFGAGGTPKYGNFFSTSTPDADEMDNFANWVLTLPAADRQTAAYPEVSDPFADPPVDTTHNFLTSRGVKSLFWNNGNKAAVSNKQIQAAATQVANKRPQIVVIGSVDIPSLGIFIHTFENHGYTPEVMIAASGPDQGQSFLDSVNPANAEAIMVPDGWYGGEQNALSHVMVQDYIAKFGGTSADINADVAEAYSAGEVLADAVRAKRTLHNDVLIKYLHSATFQTVQGAARFNSVGENTLAVHEAFIFQWQNSQFLPVLPTGGAAATIEKTKPRWNT